MHATELGEADSCFLVDVAFGEVGIFGDNLKDIDNFF
jgi:hypothetical protein